MKEANWKEYKPDALNWTCSLFKCPGCYDIRFETGPWPPVHPCNHWYFSVTWALIKCINWREHGNHRRWSWK